MDVIATFLPLHQATPPPSDEGNDGEPDIDRQIRPGRRADVEDVEKARQDGDQHAEAGDEDARRRRHRRRHALQAVHEEKGRREIGRADDQLRKRWSSMSVPQPFFAWWASAWPCFACCGLVPAHLEHREHAIGDGIAARGIAGAEQHGEEADRLFQHRARVEQGEDARRPRRCRARSSSPTSAAYAGSPARGR